MHEVEDDLSPSGSLTRRTALDWISKLSAQDGLRGHLCYDHGVLAMAASHYYTAFGEVVLLAQLELIQFCLSWLPLFAFLL
jgi:hypothetical protein